MEIIVPKPPKSSKMVEIEDEDGNVTMGVVERMTEDGDVVVRILSTDKILVFKSNFLK